MTIMREIPKEDITLEFYHKTAVYNSSITGCKTNINIKNVYKVQTRAGQELIVIISDKGNHYHLEELTLPS